mmetsp:Transcript_20967/g.30232  ORF Transcript_20967/g.30232 Transcript_20967/m.30232 type:complete len:369 (-) Transcript_20967:60-1166(-)
MMLLKFSHLIRCRRSAPRVSYIRNCVCGPSSSSARVADRGLNIAVVCGPDNPALKYLPSIDNVQFTVADTAEKFKESNVEKSDGVIVIQPADINVLIDLWYSHLSNVKWVHSFYAGVDALAPFISGYIVNRNDVILTNGRGAFSSSLAEYIITAALYFNKQICRLQTNRRDSKWEKFPMHVLKGKTMGFIGFGDIAKSTAKIAKESFGMKIVVYRRNPTKTDIGDNLVDKQYEHSQNLFADSDFVVCTLPGTPETYKYCSSQFAVMKPLSVFISCGRGSAVDEEALYSALTQPEHKHICAALDVFATEPLPTTSPLWSVPDDRLLITSHNADYTEDYFKLGWDVFEKNLQCFIDGKGMVTPVDKELLY